jgi:hypothetical protein
MMLNLPSRLEEWSAIADLPEWHLELLFLVHDAATKGSLRPTDLPIQVALNVRTFQQHADEIVLPQVLANPQRALELFNRWVVEPLNAPNTPASTKGAARILLEENL